MINYKELLENLEVDTKHLYEGPTRIETIYDISFKFKKNDQVEEFKKLLENQIEKKPISRTWLCSKCKEELASEFRQDYCFSCGQKIGWGVRDE